MGGGIRSKQPRYFLICPQRLSCNIHKAARVEDRKQRNHSHTLIEKINSFVDEDNI